MMTKTNQKRSGKTWAVVLLATVGLMSCDRTDTTQKSVRFVLQADTSPVLGTGYNEAELLKRGQCVGGEKKIYRRPVGMVSGFTFGHSAEDDGDVEKILAGPRLLQNAKDLTPEANFYRELFPATKAAFSGFYSPSLFEFGGYRLESARRTKMGEAVSKNGDWESQCGDTFVRYIQSGAEVYVGLKVEKGGAEEDAEVCNDAIHRALDRRGGPGKQSDPIAAIGEILDGSCEKGSVSILLLQRGGEVSRIPDSFEIRMAMGNRGLGVAKCNSGNIANCLKAADSLPDYLYGDNSWINSVDKEKMVGDVGGPAALSYSLTSYKLIEPPLTK